MWGFIIFLIILNPQSPNAQLHCPATSHFPSQQTPCWLLFLFLTELSAVPVSRIIPVVRFTLLGLTGWNPRPPLWAPWQYHVSDASSLGALAKFQSFIGRKGSKNLFATSDKKFWKRDHSNDTLMNLKNTHLPFSCFCVYTSYLTED